MVLAEREILNSELEALREKLALPPPKTVIQKEDNPYKNFDAIIQIMNVDFLCEVKNTVTTATIGNIVSRLRMLAATEKQPVLLIAKYITPTMVNINWMLFHMVSLRKTITSIGRLKKGLRCL